MADVNTTLANRALSLIGNDPITDYHQNIARGVQVRLHFDGVRDMLQRRYQWNFIATRFSAAADAVSPVFGFTFQYTLPPDCLRVWHVVGQKKNSWHVEGNKLLTNAASPVKIRYGKLVKEPGSWDALFTDLFVNELALRCAPKLSQSKERIRDVRDTLTDLHLIAEQIDAAEREGEDPDDEEPTIPWLEAYTT